MSWIVDNPSDEAVIECQKEIRRLRGVVREMEKEARKNLPSERAVWKDHEIIGHIYLTDEQVEALNNLKDIGIFVGENQL